MIGTITFGRGQEAETFGVLQVLSRYEAGKPNEVSTVRIKLNRPHKNRTVLTTPEKSVTWLKEPVTARQVQRKVRRK